MSIARTPPYDVRHRQGRTYAHYAYYVYNMLLVPTSTLDARRPRRVTGIYIYAHANSYRYGHTTSHCETIII